MSIIEIGQHIAKLRRTHGWSQTTLAHKAGVSRAFVCNLERGAGGDPGLRKVLDILALFDHTLAVMAEDGPPTLDQLLEAPDD